MRRADHWDSRYREFGAESVSWFQEQPTDSLELFAALGVSASASVLDVGGGASRLVDHLVATGHVDITVLDLSEAALDLARARLRGSPVTWVRADVTSWEPERTWNVWHDRAVLHFLVDDRERDAYLRTLFRAVATDGVVVIGTFAEDGPTRCSNLEVRRYSQRELRDLLGDSFEVIQLERRVHRTPSGVAQPFNWVAGRRCA